MATVVKDFKVKSGLVVEGTNGTINGFDILTKKTADQNYIVGLIGGTATAENVADKVVKRDGSGNFAAGTITADLVGDVTGDVTGNVFGNADTATALETARTIALSGDVTGSVSFDGTSNVTITATVDGSFATDSEVATAKQEAIDSAALDATSKANTAEANANDYTDGEISDLDAALKLYADQAESDAISTAASDATTKANAAQANAEDYADGVALTAENNAKSYADGLAVNYDAAGSAAAAEAAAKSYADDKVADLVDGAPALLDTLNELAAAIADNPNYATDVANLVAGKQDTLTAGANIDITDDVISVTGLDTADVAEDASRLYFTDARAQAALAGMYDVAGAAADAEANANDYTDTVVNGLDTDDIEEGTTNKYFTDARALTATASAYDAAGSAAAAQSAAETFATNAINALDTDDIEEGNTNLYYTTGRAKTDAAALLVNATKTNIQISGDGNGLVITAENGVADSDTDDLVEGTSNLYFTDQRAVDALQGTDSVFKTVSIDEVALQVAATLFAPTAGIQSAYVWNSAAYSSAEFLVKVAYGTHTEISKVLLTLDTSDNVAITEYAIVGTNGSASSISASVVDGEVSLDVTTNNNNSTVTVVGTLLV